MDFCLFIVIEGIDGSGQDTQAELLKAWVKKKGHQVVWLTREPTDSEVGQQIRAILRGEKASPGSAELQGLMAQDRFCHQAEILTRLQQGAVVISVRYYYSTLAYGGADGLNVRELWRQNQDFRRPDLAIYLDLDPKSAMERIEKRGAKIELFEQEEFLVIVRQKFLGLVGNPNFSELVTVDANGTPNAVHQAIVKLVQNKFPLQFPN